MGSPNSNTTTVTPDDDCIPALVYVPPFDSTGTRPYGTAVFPVAPAPQTQVLTVLKFSNF